MSKVFAPRLDILPDAQRQLWLELAETPSHFVLYGGTAIALRLGHRQSVDFDFMSPVTFEPQSLLQDVKYLKNAQVRRSAANNLTATVDRGGPVQLQYFGNFDLGQVAAAELADGPKIQVASLLDLGGMKAAVVTQRAETKDYLDIHALLTTGKISLPTMLAAGLLIYGDQFDPLLSLKAIAYHADPALKALPQTVRNYLSEAVHDTDPTNLPVLKPLKVRGQKS
jgi:YD repeat-containing protein